MISFIKSFSQIPYSSELRRFDFVESINGCLLLAFLESQFKDEVENFEVYLSPLIFQDVTQEIVHYTFREVSNGFRWLDVTGMTAFEFREAFEELGIIYKSKDEWLQTKDKFKGKYYCCFPDDEDNNITCFFRNTAILEREFVDLYMGLSR